MASTSVDPQTAATPVYEREERTRPAHLGRAFFFGVLLMLVVGYLAYAIIGYGLSHFQTLDQKRVLEREKILKDRLDEDSKLLKDEPSWFKKDKGQIRVPITQAMALTVADLEKIKPRATDVPVTAQIPNAAPTSPDKGVASPSGNQVNPPATQPTTLGGAPSPSAAPVGSPAPSVPGGGQPAGNPPPQAPAGQPAGAVASGNAGPGSPAPPAANPAPASSQAPAPAPQATPGASQASVPTASPAPPANAGPAPQPSAAAPGATAPATQAPAPAQPGATPAGTP